MVEITSLKLIDRRRVNQIGSRFNGLTDGQKRSDRQTADSKTAEQTDYIRTGRRKADGLADLLADKIGRAHV